MNGDGSVQSDTVGFYGTAEGGLLDQMSGTLSQISIHFHSREMGSNQYAVENT